MSFIKNPRYNKGRWRQVFVESDGTNYTLKSNDIVTEISSNKVKLAKDFHVTIPVFLEIEIGLDRCGVRTAEEAIALAAGIAQLDNIYIKGIQAYEGRGNGSTTSEAKKAYAGETVGKAVAIKQALAEAGYEF